MPHRTISARLLAIAILSLSTILAVSVTAATPRQAGTLLSSPTDYDSRWLPWVGCWRLWEEQVERAAGRADEFPERTMVCVSPTADNVGVLLSASATGQTLAQRTLIADGTQRDVTDGDCQGWEQRAWSSDGHRLFTRAELRCEAPTLRRTSGVSFFSTNSNWIDIQLVKVGDREHLEIRRYTPIDETERLLLLERQDDPITATERQELLNSAQASQVNPRTIRELRQVSTASLNLSNVREALLLADTQVVEAMLTETEPRLDLNAQTLIELDNAGIDGSVIDLLVALAYPERFVVERRSSDGGYGGFRRFGSYSSYDPIWYHGLYPYYVTPLGYGGWLSGYSPYFYPDYGNPFISIRDDGGGSQTNPRIIEDRGYTRVAPRAINRNSGGAVSGRGMSPGSTGSSAPRSRGGGGGGVSSGGYSRGGGGGGDDSGGRTAVPRR